MATAPFCFYLNSFSIFSAAVLSEFLRKWLNISIVVPVRAWLALPATVTSDTPAAICIVILVCHNECTVLRGSPPDRRF